MLFVYYINILCLSRYSYSTIHHINSLVSPDGDEVVLVAGEECVASVVGEKDHDGGFHVAIVEGQSSD